MPRWGRRSKSPAARPPTPLSASASLGARSAFIGKVKDDPLGRAFAHDIRAAGVAFTTPPAPDGAVDRALLLLVTPDGERTMNTYLGAAQNLHPADIDADLVAGSAISISKAICGIRSTPRMLSSRRRRSRMRPSALSRSRLSDAFCVDRWRGEFLHLMRSHTVDLIFANEAELRSLYETADFDTAVAALRKDVGAAVVTRSEKGCVVIGPDGTEAVPAFPVERVVDTTGAGDSVCRRLSRPGWRAAPTTAPAAGSARSPPAR